MTRTANRTAASSHLREEGALMRAEWAAWPTARKEALESEAYDAIERAVHAESAMAHLTRQIEEARSEMA